MTPSTLEAPAEPAKLVSCYYLGDYERNGHDDSDFYVVFWNDAEGKIETREFGSTRYGGGWNYAAELIREIPAEVLARLSDHIYRRDLNTLTDLETRRVTEPEPQALEFGARVRFLKNSDKRSKFEFRAGDTGECFWQGWYGTFYANGYKSRGRHNGRVGVRLESGRKVFAPMTAVRLNCEPDLARSEVQARANAKALRVRCPGAWWTNVNPAISG